MSFNQTSIFSDKTNFSHKKREISKWKNFSKLFTSKVKLSWEPTTALEELDPLVADAFIRLSIEKWLSFEDFFLRQVNIYYERASDLERKLFLWKLNYMVKTREQVSKLAKELKKA